MGSSGVFGVRRVGNYFRVGDGRRAVYVFFDDDRAEDTERAWLKAVEAAKFHHKAMSAEGYRSDGRICMWRPPLHPGAWDFAQLVGYPSMKHLGKDTFTLVERREEVEKIEFAFSLRRRGHANLPGSSSGA